LRRNCLLQQVIEGKIKGGGGIDVKEEEEGGGGGGRRGRTRRRRTTRRHRKLLDDLKERRGYFHLKEEALDRKMWRAHFGRGLGLS
jgi:hypothetical protein